MGRGRLCVTVSVTVLVLTSGDWVVVGASVVVVGASVVVSGGAVVVGDSVTVWVNPGGGAGSAEVLAGASVVAGAVVVTVVVPVGVVSSSCPAADDRVDDQRGDDDAERAEGDQAGRLAVPRFGRLGCGRLTGRVAGGSVPGLLRVFAVGLAAGSVVAVLRRFAVGLATGAAVVGVLGRFAVELVVGISVTRHGVR